MKIEQETKDYLIWLGKDTLKLFGKVLVGWIYIWTVSVIVVYFAG